MILKTKQGFYISQKRGYNNAIIMSEGLQLPSYFPVSRSLQRELEDLRDSSTSLDELKKTQEEILKAAVTYFQLLFPDDANSEWNIEGAVNLELIKQLLDSYESLVGAQQQTTHFNQTFNKAKNQIRARLREEPELSVDNIDAYRSVGTNKKSFGEILDEELKRVPPIKKDESNPDYIFLKNATFVISHPLDPLPDEEDDDDIQVGGGKIDLKCPISMNYFDAPMISTKCNHTFDQASILGTWRSAGVMEDCPTPGCRARLRRADFIPDRLMTLRVKSFKAQEKKLENAEEYEKLD